jgi:hypothetical protein
VPKDIVNSVHLYWELTGQSGDPQAMTANAVLEGHTLLLPSEARQASVGGSGGRVVTLFS